MQSAFQRIRTGVTLFAIAILISVIGYIALGWPVLDVVYRVVITIFGAEYGEV